MGAAILRRVNHRRHILQRRSNSPQQAAKRSGMSALNRTTGGPAACSMSNDIRNPSRGDAENHLLQGVSVGAGRWVAAFWFAWEAWSQGRALGCSTHSQ